MPRCFAWVGQRADLGSTAAPLHAEWWLASGVPSEQCRDGLHAATWMSQVLRRVPAVREDPNTSWPMVIRNIESSITVAGTSPLPDGRILAFAVIPT